VLVAAGERDGDIAIAHRVDLGADQRGVRPGRGGDIGQRPGEDGDLGAADAQHRQLGVVLEGGRRLPVGIGQGQPELHPVQAGIMIGR
jgi:hypothetical protein